MKQEYEKYKNDEYIDDDFKGNGLNNDLDAFKQLARLGLNNIEESLRDKRVSNNDSEIQLRAKFLKKIITLIDEEQSKKPLSPQRSPPPIVRATRGARPSIRHSRTPSPISRLGQNSPQRIFRSRGVRASSASPTTFDGRVRSSGGKRTRKHKSRKHKRSKHKSRKHKHRKA